MPIAPFEPFFLEVDGDKSNRRFCIYHPAQGRAVRGAILYIHPFAEEMNKSRRMAALQSRAFAKAGYAVLQIDLLGCGDSSGNFGDATWADWVEDVVRGVKCLEEHTRLNNRAASSTDVNQDTAASLPLWLWGLRAGCLLLADAARQLARPANFLFWAPTLIGKVQLQQFLRLKAAGDMLGGSAKGAMDKLRKQLAAGSAVEVAGYSIAPALAQGMEQAVLEPPRSDESTPMADSLRVEWFELSTRDEASLSPVVQKATDAWHQAGYAVQSHIVNGPSFWQTTEIEDAPALLDATVASLSTCALLTTEATAT
jgi:uncharacterized protein